MAKVKGTTASGVKTTFGSRRVGKHKKSNGPKAARTKKYRGQGR